MHKQRRLFEHSFKDTKKQEKSKLSVIGIISFKKLNFDSNISI